MLKFSKRVARSCLNRMGYDVGRRPGWPGIGFRRLPPVMGRDGMRDLVRVLRSLDAARTRPPVVFDVGANNGATIRRLREVFRDPIIHAFEPGRDTFEELRRVTAGLPNLTLNPFALGAARQQREFVEHEFAFNSSFLQPGREAEGKTLRTVAVEIRTVDDYCAEHGIEAIDVLKTDTQGFDLEVIRGAEGMIRAGRVGVIYTEVIFADLYEGQPSLDEFYRHLSDRGFRLVGFYEFHHQNDRAGWADAMFARS